MTEPNDAPPSEPAAIRALAVREAAALAKLSVEDVVDIQQEQAGRVAPIAVTANVFGVALIVGIGMCFHFLSSPGPAVLAIVGLAGPVLHFALKKAGAVRDRAIAEACDLTPAELADMRVRIQRAGASLWPEWFSRLKADRDWRTFFSTARWRRAIAERVVREFTAEASAAQLPPPAPE